MAERLGTQLQSGGLEQSIHTGLLGSGLFGGASLDLNFAVTKNVGPLVTFTRASSATYIDSAGTLRTAVTNLLLRSEEFDNASWTPTALQAFGSGSIANAIASPSSSITADLITENTANSEHNVLQAITVTVNTVYTLSCFAKKGTRSILAMSPTSPGVANYYTLFNLDTGAIVFNEVGNTSTITALGNGWYRCSITRTTGAAQVLSNNKIGIANNVLSTTYTGDGTSGIYVWGAQLEQSSTVGEYIPTTSATNSAPRFDHAITSSRTNHIRNNTMVGAVAGTPGTAPSNWSFPASQSGLAVNVVGTGVENGINYVDFRFFGTTTSALFGNVSFESFTSVAATQSSLWTHSAYLKLAGGSTANINTVRLVMDNYNSLGTALTQYAVSLPLSISTASLESQRFSVSTLASTFSNAATAFVRPYIQVEANSGVAIDITLRIGMPQLEQGSVATSVIPTSTGAVTVNTTESLGLLVEEQRTNSIRNNTMVGAVAGTPGTLPTNWNAFSQPTGVTRSVIGTGTQNGIAYIDIRFNGTASGAGELSIFPEGTGALLFTAGTVLSGSAWLSLVGGSTSNIASVTLRTVSYLGATYVSEGNAVISITPTLTRFAFNNYTTAATSDRVLPTISVNVAAAGAIDITLRIGLPQLEQGAFATSVIPTSTAAATRSANVASITGANFSSWYRQDEGTVFVEYTGVIAGVNRGVWALTADSSNSNNIIDFFNGGLSPVLRVNSSGVNQAYISTGTATTATFNKVASAFAQNNFARSLNGLAADLDTSGTMPATTPILLNIGTINAYGVASLSGTIRRLTFFPQRLANSTLQAITQ